MAEVVLGIGSSHGPSIQLQPEEWSKLGARDPNDPRFDYEELLRTAPPGLDKEIKIDVQRERHAAARAALEVLSNIIAESNLDIVVVISNPHKIREADNHPVFGVFRAESFPVERRKAFDPDMRFIDEEKCAPAQGAVDKHGHRELANYLVDSLIAADFDVACMDSLPKGAALDDAFVFPYEWLLDEDAPPMVPFMVSRDLPNQAHPKRCYQLGRALRRVIDTWNSNARVGLIASGGLSHQILDEELDRQVIRALEEMDADTLCRLPRERLNRGPGTPETLNWVVVSAAMSPTPMTVVDYQPAYRSPAGTGHGLTFGYWR